MNESDWKIFEQIKKQAIDRYCQDAFDEFTDIIAAGEQPIYERYQALLKLVSRSDENMQLLFEGHSKGNASYQLMGIRAEGLADEELLRLLSQEFLASTDPSEY